MKCAVVQYTICAIWCVAKNLE